MVTVAAAEVAEAMAVAVTAGNIIAALKKQATRSGICFFSAALTSERPMESDMECVSTGLRVKPK